MNDGLRVREGFVSQKSEVGRPKSEVGSRKSEACFEYLKIREMVYLNWY